MLVAMMDDKYRPRSFDEMAEDMSPVSIINEPIHDEVIELRPGQASASLHALLVGVRNQAQALLERMENRGVQVARQEQREIIRLLYVATRHQVKALAAVLELDGLE
jgi:hypothetical protein